MRAEGFYWVKRHDVRSKFETMVFAWEVARFEHIGEDADEGLWFLTGWDEPRCEDGLSVNEHEIVLRSAANLRILPHA